MFSSAMHFKKESVIRASAQRVFAFHEAPDAFERLQPPWQKTEIVHPPTSLEVGTRVARNNLERLFEYRHQVTREACES